MVIVRDASDFRFGVVKMPVDWEFRPGDTESHGVLPPRDASLKPANTHNILLNIS